MLTSICRRENFDKHMDHIREVTLEDNSNIYHIWNPRNNPIQAGKKTI